MLADGMLLTAASDGVDWSDSSKMMSLHDLHDSEDSVDLRDYPWMWGEEFVSPNGYEGVLFYFWKEVEQDVYDIIIYPETRIELQHFAEFANNKVVDDVEKGVYTAEDFDAVLGLYINRALGVREWKMKWIWKIPPWEQAKRDFIRQWEAMMAA